VHASSTLTGLGPFLFLWSAGGDYDDARLTRSTLTEPAAVSAVQFLVDLIRKHRFWPALALSSAGAHQRGAVNRDRVRLGAG
jgi:hypothetical protein